MDYELKVAKGVPSSTAHGEQKEWDFEKILLIYGYSLNNCPVAEFLLLTSNMGLLLISKVCVHKF